MRQGGGRTAAPPKKFGQLRYFGQEEKIRDKPILQEVCKCMCVTFNRRGLFSVLN